MPAWSCGNGYAIFTLGAPHHSDSAACVHLGLLLTVVVAMPTRAAPLAATRPLTGSGLVA